jgi:hypothetical protein
MQNSDKLSGTVRLVLLVVNIYAAGDRCGWLLIGGWLLIRTAGEGEAAA